MTNLPSDYTENLDFELAIEATVRNQTKIG